MQGKLRSPPVWGDSALHSFGLYPAPIPWYLLNFYFVSFHSPGEALDIYDILKLTHNGVLEEDPQTERDRRAQKESIYDSLT